MVVLIEERYRNNNLACFDALLIQMHMLKSILVNIRNVVRRKT